MNTKQLILTVIVAPIAVGVILLGIEYGYFTGSNLEQQAERLVEKVTPSASSSDEAHTEGDISDLNTLLSVADKLYGTAERNAEFVKLITVALAQKKPSFALRAAGKLYGTTIRNEQFGRILDKCLELKRYETALKAADALYGTSARNEAFRKIVAAGSAVHAQTSN